MRRRPPAPRAAGDRIYDELAALTPPRKHYQRYYSTREANDNMWHAPQGIHAFLRAYYHMKSADWKQNKPARSRPGPPASGRSCRATTSWIWTRAWRKRSRRRCRRAAEIAACKWLPDDELRVYSDEYGRTGFQGGLQGYRVGSAAGSRRSSRLFSGRTIDVPSMFIGGKSDWGVYQNPGALERMQKTACTQMLGTHLVDGAGHWVQQEQPEAVSELLVEFLRRARHPDRRARRELDRYECSARPDRLDAASRGPCPFCGRIPRMKKLVLILLAAACASCAPQATADKPERRRGKRRRRLGAAGQERHHHPRRLGHRRTSTARPTPTRCSA